MTDANVSDLLTRMMGVALIIGGVFFLGWGSWALLLTGQGDRGGDSGIRESGCVFTVGGIVFLIVGIALIAWGPQL